jgi:hypothetical protein
MRNAFLSVVLATLSITFAGCPRSASSTRAVEEPAIEWVQKELAHGDAKIALGIREEAPNGKLSLEPVAAITRDGQPVAGAMVFVSLVAPGEDSANAGSASEVATVYQPASGQTPALYSPVPLDLPGGKAPSAVRFRIVLPSADSDFTHEISLP